MSAAINHVRLLAPEDFFAPIALVMKAPPAAATLERDALEQEFRKGAAARRARACARIMASTVTGTTVGENDC